MIESFIDPRNETSAPNGTLGMRNRVYLSTALTATAFTAIAAATSGITDVHSMGNAEVLANSVGNYRTITSGVTPEPWVTPDNSRAYLSLAFQLHAKAIRIESLFESLASGEPVDTAQIHQEAVVELSELAWLSRRFHSEVKYSFPLTSGPGAGMRPMSTSERRLVMISEPIAPAIERIRGFADLEPSWDGEGAARLSPISASEASSLLVSSLDTRVYASGAQVDVVPTPTGGLLLEWRSANSRVQVNVHEDGEYSGFTASVVEGKTRNRSTIAGAGREKVREILSNF